jgi:NAD(P)-dependent dehydrogenase (short-subunit alcohol dehydrogenase family)
MTEIRGKASVVTGGGSGIGMGLAKELARQGAAVAVADIILDNARKVADEIAATGGKAVALYCDVCERDSIKEMKAQANKVLGTVQLLFANAGATSFTPLMEMSDNDVDWIIQVNLMGVVNTTRAFLPDMMLAREGHIVATASMAGLLPGWIPVHVPYSAAKMGIIGFMMNLGLEMKPYNIYTASYCPGGVATGMKANNSSYRPARFGGPTKGEVDVPKASFEKNPVTFYSPESIAPMVLRAVRNNRPLIFDHGDQRKAFRETYSQIVEACYDDIDAYESEIGIPDVVQKVHD